MIVKTRTPGFFFEFKKNRTNLLKEREPPIPEPFYKKFIREKKEKEQKEARLQREKEIRAKELQERDQAEQKWREL